jgi:hypothetical protein
MRLTALAIVSTIMLLSAIEAQTIASVAFAGNKFQVNLLRTDFEVNTAYAGPLFEITPPCSFDDWSHNVNWGAAGTGRVSHPNERTITTDHIFSKIGKHNIVLDLAFHCRDTAPGKTSAMPANFEISVHPRVPVCCFSIDQRSLRGGEPVNGILTLTSAAPPSGTRVTIRSDNDAIPSTDVVVPPGDTAVAFSLATKKVQKTMVVRLQAQMIGRSQTSQIVLQSTSEDK